MLINVVNEIKHLRLNAVQVRNAGSFHITDTSSCQIIMTYFSLLIKVGFWLQYVAIKLTNDWYHRTSLAQSKKRSHCLYFRFWDINKYSTTNYSTLNEFFVIFDRLSKLILNKNVRQILSHTALVRQLSTMLLAGGVALPTFSRHENRQNSDQETLSRWFKT